MRTGHEKGKPVSVVPEVNPAKIRRLERPREHKLVPCDVEADAARFRERTVKGPADFCRSLC